MNDQTINFKKCIYEISYYFIIFPTFTFRIHVCVHVGINNIFIYIKDVVVVFCEGFSIK
jgi:hypothetical protein